jgi:hypothetical protein
MRSPPPIYFGVALICARTKAATFCEWRLWASQPAIRVYDLNTEEAIDLIDPTRGRIGGCSVIAI